MTTSADDPRLVKRREFHLRVTRTSRRLALERGYDGYTMDDLAAEVGVSRRTLFNHFPGKDATIFGVNDDDCDQPNRDLVEEFLAGRPTGRLFSDLVALCTCAIREDDPVSPADVREMLTVLEQNPSLRAGFQQRLDDIVDDLGGHVAQRLGTSTEDRRCRLTVQMLRGVVVVAATDFAHSDGTTPLDQIFSEYAAILHTLD